MASQVYDDFVERYAELLRGMELPQALWPNLCQKLEGPTFDIGSILTFYVDEDAVPGSQYGVAAIEEVAAYSDVYLLDHMWTFEDTEQVKYVSVSLSSIWARTWVWPGQILLPVQILSIPLPPLLGMLTAGGQWTASGRRRRQGWGTGSKEASISTGGRSGVSLARRDGGHMILPHGRGMIQGSGPSGGPAARPSVAYDPVFKLTSLTHAGVPP